MTRAEIELLIGRVNDENARQNKRIDKLETIMESINDLTGSVKELAVQMQSMQKELERQGGRLTVIESEPAEKWRAVVKTALTVIVSALVTFLLTNGGI